LSVAYHESLLHTRAWILELAGFSVVSAQTLSQALHLCQNHAFDLMIVGHSLPRKDRECLAAMARMQHIRVLSLFKPGDPPLPGADFSLEAMEGPEKLIQIIKHVLTSLPPSAEKTEIKRKKGQSVAWGKLRGVAFAIYRVPRLL